MFPKNATTGTPVIASIAQRWSGRAYDPARPVERTKLLSLLEAARWAPSCFGYQPWRFLIWDRMKDADNWQKALECLVEGNRAWARHAPVLMLACADTCFSDDRPNRWCHYDTGSAVMSLSLQATALGLMVHQMGGFDATRAHQVFGIPEQFECMTFISLGYQLPANRIPDELQERELAARRRNPLSAIAFEGGWNQPIE